MLLWAFLSAIATGVIWGITPALYSEATRRNGPICANAWKSWGALTVSWLIITVLDLFEVPSPKTFTYIALNSLLGAVAGDYAFFRGIALSGAGKATPVGFTYILWASIISTIFLGEPFSSRVILGAMLSVFGIWLLSTEKGEWNVIGIAWSLLASLMWAMSPMVMRLALVDINPVAASAWGSFIMAAIFSVLAVKSKRLRGVGTEKAILGGGIGIGIGLTLFYYSVSEIGVSVPVLATAISPLVAQVASWAEGEPLTLRTIMGSAVIALGMTLGVV